MFDILIAIFEELFGTKGKPKSTPRRQVRGSGGGRTSGGFGEPAPPEVNREFEDMVKQLFGGAAPAAPAPAEKPRQQPAPEPVQVAARRSSSRQLSPEQRERVERRKREHEAKVRKDREKKAREAQVWSGEQPDAERALAAESASAPPAAEPAFQARPAAPASTATRSRLPAYVQRIRNNPNAAREAFVYAEIFGPPLADR